MKSNTPKIVHIRANAQDRLKTELRFSRDGTVTIEAAAADQKGPPKFKMVAYTGAAMQVGFSLPMVVDLAGMRKVNGAKPILHNHDTSQIVGHTDSVVIGANDITVTGVISGSSEIANQVVASSRAGFPWQASIGASIDWNKVDKFSAGQKVTVNGQEFTGPVYVARASVLQEISFVALGADENTSAAVAAHKEQNVNKFNEWLKAKGFDPANLTAESKTFLKAQFDAEEAEAAKGDADKGVKAKADVSEVIVDATDDAIKASRMKIAAEAERVAAIQAATEKHLAVRAEAIKGGWTVEQTKQAVELADLKASRPAAPKPRTAGTAEPQESQIIECAALLMLGVSAKFLEASYDKRTIDAATQREYRSMTPASIMRRVAAAAGEHAGLGVGHNSDDLIRAAFSASVTLKASASVSSMSLPGILSNVAGKVMLDSFVRVPSTVDLWCGQQAVNDFKTVSMYRLAGTGTWQKVGQDGELKSGRLEESAYTARAETYGQIIGITRQMLKNDDLGAMMRVPALMGRGAAIAREKAAFDLLVTGLQGGSPFFSAGNRNISTGVLSIAGLSGAEKVFMDQVDANSDPIMLQPTMLLVPTALSTTAGLLYTQTSVNETTTANAPRPNGNPHSGKFRPVVSTWLNPRTLDSNNVGSDTAYFLLGDPTAGSPVNIVYVDGQRTPTIEEGQLNFDQLGLAMRGYWDFGVGRGDPRSCVRSTGA